MNLKKVGFSIFLILSLVGCLSEGQNYSSNPTSTPKSEVFEPPDLAAATPAAVSSDFLNDLLLNKICDLPCFLNVTPGKTPIASAIEALSEYGYINFYQDDSNPELNHHEFRLDFPDMGITIIGYFYSKNDMLTNIIYDVYSEDHTKLKNFTIENLLRQHGEPSSIWIEVGVHDPDFSPTETSFDLIFYYPEINTLAVIFGTAVLKDGHYVICPEQPFAFSTQENPERGITRIVSGDPNYYQTPNSLVEPSDWEVGELSAERGTYFAPITMDTYETIESLTNGIIDQEHYCFDWFPNS